MDILKYFEHQKNGTPDEYQIAFDNLKRHWVDEKILEKVCYYQLKTAIKYIWEYKPLCPTWNELAGIFLNEIDHCYGHPITIYIAGLGGNKMAAFSFMKNNKESTLDNPWITKALLGAIYWRHYDVADIIARHLY